MRFQVLDIVFNPPHPVTGEAVPPADRLARVVETAVLAEQLGIDAFAVGERHAGEVLSSSPTVLLGALAASTSRILLSTGRDRAVPARPDPGRRGLRHDRPAQPRPARDRHRQGQRGAAVPAARARPRQAVRVPRGELRAAQPAAQPRGRRVGRAGTARTCTMRRRCRGRSRGRSGSGTARRRRSSRSTSRPSTATRSSARTPCSPARTTRCSSTGTASSTRRAATTRRTRSSAPARAGCSSRTPPSRPSSSTGRSTRARSRRQDLRKHDPARGGQGDQLPDHRGGRRARSGARRVARAGRGEDPRLPRQLRARPAVGLDQPRPRARRTRTTCCGGSRRRSSRWSGPR